MATITFKDYASYLLFDDMVTGMWEVARDDGDMIRESRLAEIMSSISGADEDGDWPLSYELNPEDVAIARDVLENCLDNNRGVVAADYDAAERDWLIEGDVTISE